MSEYDGSIELISGITPKNGGTFPLVNAADVLMPDGTRLNEQTFDTEITDEQVADAVTAWLDEHPEATTTVQDGSIGEPKLTAALLAKIESGGGLNSAARVLLITILRNAVYSTNQSANITALEEALASGDDGDTPTVPGTKNYSVNIALGEHVSCNNPATSAAEGSAYTAILTADEGYKLSNVTVTMGGVNVTSTVYANGTVTIASVTGEISIVAAAVAQETAVTPTSISATYSGGDVPTGTALTDLTGIVVTGHYSDGSTTTVTDYTLSGTIAEGSNIITVSYGGKTATFTVNGVAESGGEDTKTINMTLVPSSSVSISGSTFYEGDADSTALTMTAGWWYKSDAIAAADTIVRIAFSTTVINAGIIYYAAQIKKENYKAIYYIEQLGSSTTTETVREYTVRAGYELVILVSNSSPIEYLNVTYTDGVFDTPSEFYTNIITSFEANAYLNGSNGAVSSGWSGQSTTDYLDVTGLDSVYSIIAGTSGYTVQYRSVAFYDADKQFISGINAAGTSAIEIPSDAVYMRVDVASGSPKWYVGTNPEPYYGELKGVA